MLEKLVRLLPGKKAQAFVQNAWQSTARHPRIKPVIGTLYTHRYVLIIPMALFTVLSIFYAVLGPKKYLASQSLVVRNELNGQEDRSGRFPSWEAARTAQETILEISKNPTVIAKTLKQVGPPPGKPSKDWPDEITIEGMQGSISISAPNGAEFGKSEVIHLSVKESSRDRARKVILALLENVEKQLRQVRYERAISMVNESQQAVKLAQENLNKSIEKLTEIESKIGPDLQELRSMNQASSGDGTLQRELLQVRAELRDALQKQNLLDSQDKMLTKALNDPAHLIQTPNELLQLQPALSDLKKGLSTARLELARVQSRYTDAHPKTRNAKRAVEDTLEQIREELSTALLGLNTQQKLNSNRIDMLKRRESDCMQRSKLLAQVRAEYAALQSETEQRSEVLKDVEEQLNKAQSTRLAAEEVNLITRIEEPQIGSAPVGPSKKMIVLGGMFGGLMIGLGLVTFLSAPFGPQTNTVVQQQTVSEQASTIQDTPMEPLLEFANELQTPTVSDNESAKPPEERKEKEKSKPYNDPNAIYILPDTLPQLEQNGPLQL